MSKLEEGDVLILRHHIQFRAAANAPSARLYATSAVRSSNVTCKSSEAGSTGLGQKGSAWRCFFKWSLTWVTVFSVCIFVSTGLLLAASLPRYRGREAIQQFQRINHALSVVCTAELIVRLLSYVTVKECIKGVDIWVDVVAIVPDYLEMALHRGLPGFEVFKSLRLLRMFKIFKLLKRSVDLITHTLYDSLSTLTKIVFFIIVGTFILATVVLFIEAVHLDPLTLELYLAPMSYLCHHESNTSSTSTLMDPLLSIDVDCQEVHDLPTHTLQCPRLFQARSDSCTVVYAISPFQNLMHAGWFTVMTLTSVGNGDIVPQTSIGALVGYFTMLTGLIAVSLPISVIASSLGVTYTKMF